VAIVFDTLEYAGRLKRAGFTDQQAEAQVQALAAIVNDNLATKQDLVLLKQDLLGVKQELKRDLLGVKQELKQDLLGVKQELRQEMRELEHRLTLRMGTMLSVAVGVVAALVKLL
jgi:coiled-coil family 90 protein